MALLFLGSLLGVLSGDTNPNENDGLRDIEMKTLHSDAMASTITKNDSDSHLKLDSDSVPVEAIKSRLDTNMVEGSQSFAVASADIKNSDDLNLEFAPTMDLIPGAEHYTVATTVVDDYGFTILHDSIDSADMEDGRTSFQDVLEADITINTASLCEQVGTLDEWYTVRKFGDVDFFCLQRPDIKLPCESEINLTTCLWDGGANSGITKGRVRNSSTVVGSITGWDGKSVQSKMEIGSRGLLAGQLSMPGNDKEIIVPAQVRKRLGGSQTWFYIKSADIHLLILTLSRDEKRKLFLDDHINSHIIAVCSRDTNFIECCTVELMRLLEITDFYQSDISYELHGDKITRCSRSVTPRKSPEINNHGMVARHCDFQIECAGPFPCHELNEFAGLRLWINNANVELGLSNETHVNVVTPSSDLTVDTPLDVFVASTGGVAVSSIHKWDVAGTLQGLKFIDEQAIQRQRKKLNLDRLKAYHQKRTMRPKNKRFLPDKVDQTSGQIMLVDAVYLHETTGSAKTKITGINKTSAVLLGVDQRTGYATGVTMKSQKGAEYKSCLIRLIDKRLREIDQSPRAQPLRYILMDQHSTQKPTFLRDVLEKYNNAPNVPLRNIQILEAEIGSHDMSVLNKVSDILNIKSHFWIHWACMPVHWMFHAYMHAITVTNLLPRVVSGHSRGKGFSPFTQFTGHASHVGMLPPPWGCSAILGGANRRGGRDYIFIGTRGQTMLFMTPLSSLSVVQRDYAILIVKKPPSDRIFRILSGCPVFEGPSLTTTSPTFSHFSMPTQIFLKDDSNGKGSSSHGCYYAFDRRLNKNGGLPKRPIQCTCGKKFCDLKDWRIHLTATWNKGKGSHPNPRKLPPKAAAQLQMIKANKKLIADYDADIMKCIHDAKQPRTLEEGAKIFSWGGIVMDDGSVRVPPDIKINKKEKKSKSRVTFAEKLSSTCTWARSTFDYPRRRISRIDAKRLWKKQAKFRKDSERINYVSSIKLFSDESVGEAGGLTNLEIKKCLPIRIDYSVDPPVPGDDDYIEPKDEPHVGESKKVKVTVKKKTVYHDKPRRSARHSHVNTFYVDYSEMCGKQHAALIKVMDCEILCPRLKEPPSEVDEVYTTQVNATDSDVEINLMDEYWKDITSDNTDVKYDAGKYDVWNGASHEKRMEDQLKYLFEVHSTNFVPDDEFWRQSNDEIGMDILMRDSPYQESKFGNDQRAESETVQDILVDPSADVDDDIYMLDKLNERGVPPQRLETIRAIVSMAKFDYDPGDPFNITNSVIGIPKDYNYYIKGGIDPGTEDFKNLPPDKKREIVNEIIGESQFEAGDYDDPAPGGIPSFLPVSFNSMLLEESPTWEAAVAEWQTLVGEVVDGEFVGYNTLGDDHVHFSTPLCEVNQCLIEIKPEVVTGLKHMDSVETQSWLSKLTSANRKRFIVNNSVGAIKSPLAPYYIQAMMKEVAGLSKLGVAEISKLPKNKRAIPCRFVFDIKWDSSTNKLVKFKARLVCQGFRQREYNQASGLGSYDPNDISSPVLKTTSLYAILNLASLTGMGLITADVGQAFLAARLKTDGSEEVYIQLPPVCQVKDGNIVIRPEILSYGRGKNKVNCVKLIKSLYGLKNSSQAWFRTIKDFLVNVAGLTQSAEDDCVFSLTTEKGTMILGIHVDDMLIAGTQEVIDTFKVQIDSHFEELGSKLTYGDATDSDGVQFLGSVIKKESDGSVTMSQEKRIEDICERFKIDRKPKGPGLPYEPGKVSEWQKYTSMPHSDEEEADVTKDIQKLNPEVKCYADVVRHYREYTGNLIWVCSAGCPQILPIVYKLARYQNTPGVAHFVAIRRVMEYMYANRTRKLTFGKQRMEGKTPYEISTEALTIFTDTSHGDCPITKRSTGGYCVFLFGSLLLIRSFRLSCTTTSTTQSEYYMMSAAAAESIYLMELYNNTLLPVINRAMEMNLSKVQKVPMMTSKLSQELISTLNSKKFPMISELNPTPLYGDNSSALLVANKGPGKNSRHSMIHASWLWDLVHQRKIITTRKVHTKCNPADLTTKQDGVGVDVFEQHTRALLGETRMLKTDINHALAHIVNVNGRAMMTSIVHDEKTDHFLIVDYDL
jgi:hypothetical protein